jgi:hypothetical protein
VIPNAAIPITFGVPNVPVLPVDAVEPVPPDVDVTDSTGDEETLAHSPAVHAKLVVPPVEMSNGHDDSPAGRSARHMMAMMGPATATVISHCSGGEMGPPRSMQIIPALLSLVADGRVAFVEVTPFNAPPSDWIRSSPENGRISLA